MMKKKLLVVLILSVCVGTSFAADHEGKGVVKDALTHASSWSTSKKVLVGAGLLAAGYAGSSMVKEWSEPAYNVLAAACIIPAAPALWDILSGDYLGLGSHEHALKMKKNSYEKDKIRDNPSVVELVQQQGEVKALEVLVLKEHVRNASVNIMLAGALGLGVRKAVGVDRGSFWGPAKQAVTGLAAVYVGGKLLTSGN